MDQLLIVYQFIIAYFNVDVRVIHSWIMLSNRITENNLLATAAAAMVHKMTRRSRPLVFRPL
jgi:hypothetical protein